MSFAPLSGMSGTLIGPAAGCTDAGSSGGVGPGAYSCCPPDLMKVSRSALLNGGSMAWSTSSAAVLSAKKPRDSA